MFPLSQAPYDIPLTFEQVLGGGLASRLSRLGISQGDVVTRKSGAAMAGPVRVRTGLGEIVLPTDMAAKIIAHHDDGHKTPISEMRPGERGHVEGLVCCDFLERSLARLGIREDQEVVMVRAIPPMDYLTILEGRRLILPQGAAAKIWGLVGRRETQFALAGRGDSLEVTELLGGRNASTALKGMGITPGVVLRLESVRPASSACLAASDQIVLTTQSGLRLYLRPEDESRIIVSEGS